MNKKIIPVVVILILLALGAVFLVTKKKSSTQTGTLSETPSSVTETPQTAKGTLKALLTGNKSQKCTFVNSTDKITVNATIYTANGKMRGDFISTSAEISMTSHMIVDSSFSYVWTDKTNQGFKFPIEDKAGVTPAPNTNSVDLNQSFDYTCTDWTVDNSLFVLPTNINFQELKIPTMSPTKAAGTTPSGNQKSKGSQCTVCDNLPAGEAQNACKTQLKCP